MPADDLDPRALALPVDEPSPAEHRSSTEPTWSRRSASFRRSDSFSTTRQPSFMARAMRTAEKLNQKTLRTYRRLSPLQKVLVIVGGITCFVLSILFLVYNERIFHSMLPFAKKWRDITGGWMILWSLIFVVSFPPLIGYSSLLTIAGFVYGFPNGYVCSPVLKLELVIATRIS